MLEPLIVCARVESKKDKIDLVKSEVIKLVDPTLNEEGCMQYILHQDIEHPEVFIFFEKWKNDESCENHMKNNHIRAFLEAVDGSINNIEISKICRLT